MADNQKYTPEPWASNGTTVYGSGGGARLTVANTTCVGSLTAEEDAENASRIVACVNALAGINPEAVADVVAALESLADMVDTCGYGNGQSERADVKRARAALARLREVK